MTTKQELLRALPSVDALLQTETAPQLITNYGRSLTLTALRHVVEERRHAILHHNGTPLPQHNLIKTATDWLENLLDPTLRPVINATGIIIHTNLGRAPLSQDALSAIHTTSQGYSTLEYNIDNGKRGSRAHHAEQLLLRLTNAEAALVVNNNAAAVILMLIALTQGKEVIISRGQLVEIGGGFRIPDVMAQSGATLVEVGTTNRTHLRDYANAITENTAAIMVAHYSNYKIIGFTAEPSLSHLAQLAHKHNLPLLYDQGSGALLDVTPYGLTPEPTVLDGLAAGSDIVAFSGDKLLGGPQAGILCGRHDLITQLKRHPLARAVRADKLCLAALAATLTPYLTEQALTTIPIWQMIARPLSHIEAEAHRWAAQLKAVGYQTAVVTTTSRVGGGSLPGSSIPSKAVAISHPNINALATDLRQCQPALVGRIQDDQLLLDPRTVLPHQVPTLLEILSNRQSSTVNPKF